VDAARSRSPALLSHVAVDYNLPGGTPGVDEGSDRVSEAIVLVGSIPCPLRHAMHDGSIDQRDWSPWLTRPKGKRARVTSDSRREIRGPGYSAELVTGALTSSVSWVWRRITWGGGTRLGGRW
jgi:hypothetical protein